MSLVSVIIPVYKVEKYLARCVDSVLAQTYKDIEIILVDDGSPDNCGKICDEYCRADSRIRVIHKENGGVSSARNAGIEAANGEYIAFVDSDDYVTETYVSDLYDAIFENDAELSACSFYLSDANGQKLCDLIEGVYDMTKAPMEVYETLVGPWMKGPFNKLFKKQVILKNNFLFNPKIPYGEDSIFVYQYLKSIKKIALIKKPLYIYQMQYSSASKKFYPDMHFFMGSVFEEEKSLILSFCNLSDGQREKMLYEHALLYCDILFMHYFRAYKIKKTSSVYQAVYDNYIQYILAFAEEIPLDNNLFLNKKSLKNAFLSGDMHRYYRRLVVKRAWDKGVKILKRLFKIS